MCGRMVHSGSTAMATGNAYEAAQNWMLKSAEQGYVPAQEGMGEMYLINFRHDGPIPGRGEAERWLRLAAMQGNADAQQWLGNGYERGWFGAADYAEALKWLREAAAQGLPWAQFGLAEMYEAGEGVPESDTVAAGWYRKAADHFSDLGGVWEAEVQLAYMYRDGRLPTTCKRICGSLSSVPHWTLRLITT